MIVLRPLKMKDADGMFEWMKDEETQRCFQYPMGEKTKEDAIDFIINAKTGLEDGNSIHFAVADEQDEYLGTVSLKHYSSRDKNAEFAISLRPGSRGKGIGEEAIRKMLRLAFEEWEMEKVYLNVLPDNIRAVRLYERCGFLCEGEFYRHLYLHGKYQNVRWYGMVRGNYISKFMDSRGGGRRIPGLLNYVLLPPNYLWNGKKGRWHK